MGRWSVRCISLGVACSGIFRCIWTQHFGAPHDCLHSCAGISAGSGLLDDDDEGLAGRFVSSTKLARSPEILCTMCLLVHASRQRSSGVMLYWEEPGTLPPGRGRSFVPHPKSFLLCSVVTPGRGTIARKGLAVASAWPHECGMSSGAAISHHGELWPGTRGRIEEPGGWFSETGATNAKISRGLPGEGDQLPVMQPPH